MVNSNIYSNHESKVACSNTKKTISSQVSVYKFKVSIIMIVVVVFIQEGFSPLKCSTEELRRMWV